MVNPSTLPGAGLGDFAERPFISGEIVQPFFGQMVDHDLQLPARSTRVRVSSTLHGADVVHPSLATTASNWMKTWLQVRTHASSRQSSSISRHAAMVPPMVGSELGLSSDQCDWPVWIVPTDFCAGGRVNDPRPNLVANVMFVQQDDPVQFPKQLAQRNCASLEVMRDINAGEEMLAKYRRRYPLT